MDGSKYILLLFGSMSLYTTVNCIQRERLPHSMEFCGKTYTVYGIDYLITARKQLTGYNPPLRCEITLQTGYHDPYYQLQITQEAVTISDCAFRLEIYAGQSGSRSLKSLSCGSKSTDVLYTRDRYAKLVLTQSRDLFAPANDFTLRVRTRRSPNAPAVDESINRDCPSNSCNCEITCQIGQILVFLVGLNVIFNELF